MTAQRPLIACTTYRKHIPQQNPIEVYGLMPSYTQAISAAGGIPVLIPQGLSEDDLQALLQRVDGLLLPGGGDVAPESYQGRPHPTMWGIDRERDRTEMLVSRLAMAQEKPLLAICRGIQIFNVALGGTLWEDLGSMRSNGVVHNMLDTYPRNHLAHTVTIVPDSTLARSLDRTETWVNSLHHQGLKELSPELTVTATAPDGLVEAVEVDGHPFALAVQWHPENLIADDPAMLNLFKSLIGAATGQDAQLA